MSPTNIAMPITKEFLEQVCLLNPSPWDDERYVLRSPTYGELLTLPEEFEGTLGLVDLGEGWPDQGNWGKCVGWSTSEALEITDYLLDRNPDNLSAEDAYNKARKYDGLPDFLEGSNNLGAMKGVHKLGVCLESCWPTSIDKADPSPGQMCNNVQYNSQCKEHGIDSYYQIPVTVGALKSAIWGLTSDPQWGEGVGVPVILGVKIPESFKDAVNGVVPIPLPGEEILGGHSTLTTGWRLIEGKLYFDNPETWGKDNGDGGVWYLPEEYITGGYIMDAWVFHNGPPIGPTPSTCEAAAVWGGVYNVGAKLFNRKTRLRAVVPDAAV